MIELLKEVNKHLREVHNEVYKEFNPSSKIKYPYVTFSYSLGQIQGQKDMYIDLDIWGETKDHIEVEKLVGDYVNYFNNKTVLTCDYLLRFKVVSAQTLGTDEKSIIRRWLQIYCKVDRRNE